MPAKGAYSSGTLPDRLCSQNSVKIFGHSFRQLKKQLYTYEIYTFR